MATEEMGGESTKRQRTLLEVIFGRREFGVVLAVLGLILFGLVVNAGVFLTLGNIVGVLRNAAVVSIVGYGMTMLMTAGEFDLSVGSILGIAAAITAVMTLEEIPIEFTLAVVFVMAICYGIFQGLLVTKLGLPSLIVTIGTLTLLRGGHLIVLGNVTQTVSSDQAPLLLRQLGGVINFPFPVLIPYTDVQLFTIPEIAYTVPFVHSEVQTFNSFPLQIFWVVLLLAIFHYLLFYTRFGYRSQATGGNQQAATFTGIRTEQIKITNFAIVALLAAFAGIGQLAFTGNVSPLTGDGQELIVIASVVIGGTDLFGGEGSMIGTFLGAMVFAFTQNILVLAGFGTQLFAVFTGMFIIFAVAVDAFAREIESDTFSTVFTDPARRLLSAPDEFYAWVDDNVQGIDAPIGYYSLTTVLWALPSLIVILLTIVPDPESPVLPLDFSLFIVNSDVEALGMLPLFAGSMAVIVAFLTIVFAHIFVRLLGSGNINRTIQTVCYAMTPVALFFVPYLAEGFRLLRPVVFLGLAAVIIPTGALMTAGMRQLHGFDTRRALAAVVGTGTLWTLTALWVLPILTR